MSNMMSVEKRTKRAAEAAPMKYVVYSGRMLSGSRPASALLDYRREVVTERGSSDMSVIIQRTETVAVVMFATSALLVAAIAFIF